MDVLLYENSHANQVNIRHTFIHTPFPVSILIVDSHLIHLAHKCPPLFEYTSENETYSCLFSSCLLQQGKQHDHQKNENGGVQEISTSLSALLLVQKDSHNHFNDGFSGKMHYKVHPLLRTSLLLLFPFNSCLCTVSNEISNAHGSTVKLDA